MHTRTCLHLCFFSVGVCDTTVISSTSRVAMEKDSCKLSFTERKSCSNMNTLLKMVSSVSVANHI